MKLFGRGISFPTRKFSGGRISFLTLKFSGGRISFLTLKLFGWGRTTLTFGRIFGRLLLFGLVRGKRLQLRLFGGGLLPCNWLHLGRSWLDRFGGFHRFGLRHRFGGLPMFGTRLLFALNMPLCFWLVPSFCNWLRRFR